LDEEGGHVAPRKPNTRPALAGASLLVIALAVEFIDELADGTKSAAFPLIRHDLGLTYGQVGLLASAPLILGSLLDFPVGVLAGNGRRRLRVVLGGGIVFVAALAGAAAARSFAGLLAAFVVFYPASGAFVTLIQASLMDTEPARREQHMARWTLAGSVGAIGGPVLLAAVLLAGGGWRAAYLVLAALAALAWLAVAWRRPRPQVALAGDGEEDGSGAVIRQAFAAARRRDVVRWVVLLEVTDLLLDVLTGFLALYFVDVAGASPAEAALAVAVRVGAGLAGDVVVIHVLERARGVTVLRVSSAAAAVLYPAFLLVPGTWPKLALLAALSVATASWYPVTQAQLYRSLPGQSGIAVSLSSVASLAGGVGPLAVGFIAERAGLTWALWFLAIAPICVFYAVRHTR
jgi:MFS transporter, FSR family, fosmidomycin resistance protein